MLLTPPTSAWLPPKQISKLTREWLEESAKNPKTKQRRLVEGYKEALQHAGATRREKYPTREFERMNKINMKGLSQFSSHDEDAKACYGPQTVNYGNSNEYCGFPFEFCDISIIHRCQRI